MPAITLCADDYGLSPGVSLAIRQLIEQGRLQATGCMTISPHWPAAAALLLPLRDRADIGLHLTLTDQTPLGPMPKLAPNGKFPSLGRLLRLSLGGGLDRAEILAEFSRQIDAFEHHFGCLPDFLDGHHHIHQLPGIGPLVLELWRTRLGGRGWIRSCFECPVAILKRGINPVRAMVISGLGIGFRCALRRAGIPHNQSFRGVYDFSGRVPFAGLFQRLTDDCPPGTLMMVHPGQVDDDLRQVDGLTDQREREWAFLASDDCVFSLFDRQITLKRLYP